MRNIVVSLVVLILFSCLVDIEHAPCISSENCPRGQYCSKSDQRCHKTDFEISSCDNSGCPESAFCYQVDRTCHLVDELGLECRDHFDCPYGQFCDERRICVTPSAPQCAQKSDCMKQNVSDADCLDGVCRVLKCNLGYSDKDMDYSNGCENVLPCTDEGLGAYGICTGDNVCKCDSNCINVSSLYGIQYDKGSCLKRCALSDVNRSFDNMLCLCTVSEMGVCKRANLFETAMLYGNVRAKLNDTCDDFIHGSVEYKEIQFTIGGETSKYNKGIACKKREGNRDVISVSLFKMDQLLPYKDIITLTLPVDIKPNQTLKTEEAGAIKAIVIFGIVDNKIQIQEIWLNAISGAGAIIVNDNGSGDGIIELNLNLKMVRYDIPLCGDVIKKDCGKL